MTRHAPPPPPTGRQITKGEAAELLGVSLKTVDRLLAAGKLNRWRLGPGDRAGVRLDRREVQQLAIQRNRLVWVDPTPED